MSDIRYVIGQSGGVKGTEELVTVTRTCGRQWLPRNNRSGRKAGVEGLQTPHLDDHSQSAENRMSATAWCSALEKPLPGGARLGMAAGAAGRGGWLRAWHLAKRCWGGGRNPGHAVTAALMPTLARNANLWTKARSEEWLGSRTPPAGGSPEASEARCSEGFRSLRGRERR